MKSFSKGDLSIKQMRRDIRKALACLVKAKLIEAVPNSNNNTYYIVATKKRYDEIRLSMSKRSGLEMLSDKIHKSEMKILPNKRHFEANRTKRENT